MGFSSGKESFLDIVHPQNNFVLADGSVIKSLPELISMLPHMPENVFREHVTEHKNDFSEWIGSTIGDDYLRNSLHGITNKDALIAILSHRLEEIKFNSALESDIHSELASFMDSKPPESTELFFDMPPDPAEMDMNHENFVLYADEGSSETLSRPEPTQQTDVAQGAPSQAQVPAKDVPGQDVPGDDMPAADVPPDVPQDIPADAPPEQEVSDVSTEEAVQSDASQDVATEEIPAEDTPSAPAEPAADSPAQPAPVQEQPPETPSEVLEQDANQGQQDGKNNEDNLVQGEVPEGQDAQPVPSTEEEQPVEQQDPQEPSSELPVETEAQEESVQQEGLVPETAPEQSGEGSQEASIDTTADKGEDKESSDAQGSEAEDKPEENAATENSDVEENNGGNSDSSDAKEEAVVDAAEEALGDSVAEEETIEIRELVSTTFGLPELDSLFKEGIPRISNVLFAGIMSSGKTLCGLKLMLEKAKKGEKAMFISYNDSEEKIINILSSLDKDVLNYVNSGNIFIKKLDPFGISGKCKTYDQGDNMFSDIVSSMDFVEIFSPSLIIVDSLSALELSFPENKQCYRQYVDAIFKYFEKLGVLAVFMKDLKEDSDLNKEFFENILADCIIHFSKDENSRQKLRVIKEYPILPKTKKKGFFSFLKKNKK